MRRRKRKKSNTKVIFLLLILLLGISIGYASLSQSLNIVGTANANGNFCIEFISAKIIDSKGINAITSKAKISDTKDTLTININDMAYPGSGATISCIIKNTGTVPAKLTGVTLTGNDDNDINVILPTAFTEGQTLNVNDSVTANIVVKWNINSSIEESKILNFSVKLDYVQDIEEYKGKTN